VSADRVDDAEVDEDGGGGDEVYGVISSFRKEDNGYVHFLGARKKNQKIIHPTKPPLYGRM
jgi:hypothetical protein